MVLRPGYGRERLDDAEERRGDVVAAVVAIDVLERPQHVELGLDQPQLGLAAADLRRRRWPAPRR